MQNFVSIVRITMFYFLITKCYGVTLKDDLTISSNQRTELDKFRKLVSSRLPHDYMREDIYLIRWLRVSNFDINVAESKLMENLQWRSDNKMDTIIYEDWSNFENQYPYALEGCDIEGRPVASANVGDWDVRKAVLTGQGVKLERYSNKLFEEITVLIRAAQDKGKNVTQFGVIMNLNNFNLVQNGCPLCIPYYVSMLTSYELHYPGSVHKVVLVNTPSLFQTVLNVLLPFVPSMTRDLLVVYGRDKALWQPKLFNFISKDQLTKQFGGTKVNTTDLDYIRKTLSYPC